MDNVDTVLGFVPSSSDEEETRIPVATVGYKYRPHGPCLVKSKHPPSQGKEMHLILESLKCDNTQEYFISEQNKKLQIRGEENLYIDH